jgi:Rad3-related DNA helicase
MTTKIDRNGEWPDEWTIHSQWSRLKEQLSTRGLEPDLETALATIVEFQHALREAREDAQNAREDANEAVQDRLMELEDERNENARRVQEVEQERDGLEDERLALLDALAQMFPIGGLDENELIIRRITETLDGLRAPSRMPTLDPWEYEDDEREAIAHEPKSIWTWLRGPAV